MSQGIQTIQAATQGIENGLLLFEQILSIANEASATLGDDIKEINASMSTLQIQQILNKGGIISLKDDIIITDTLNINTSDTTIVGNGHSITYVGSYGFKDTSENGKLVNKVGDSAIHIIANAKISGITINYSNTSTQGAAITISGASANIDNITINGSTETDRMYGIQVIDNGHLTLDTTNNININAEYGEKLINGNPNIWSGEYNTDKILEQLRTDSVATYAVNNFAPTSSLLNDEIFGQGNWYLPSIGELTDMYGYDYKSIDMNTGGGTTGITADNKNIINNTLSTLKDKGVTAETFSNGYYWSSSEAGTKYSWVLNMNSGYRRNYYKDSDGYVRASLLLDNCFPTSDCENSNIPPIAIGDVVYSDLSYGKANNYDNSKVAVGVVYWVSEDGSSAKIINLKNLTVSTNNETGLSELDVNNPYTGTNRTMKWQNNDYTNIADINDYDYSDKNRLLSFAMNYQGEITITNKNVEAINLSTTKYNEQFNLVLNAYDKLIIDSSYQGVNLLTGGDLIINFNESHTHELTVKGKNMSSEKIGIQTKNWQTTDDIKRSLDELMQATTEIRNFISELGNNYQLIQTRQRFTEALSDVLETGADKLVLADMNETSAEYLMLQTRQQLAVNALSLASQSAQSILSLF